MNNSLSSLETHDRWVSLLDCRWIGLLSLIVTTSGCALCCSPYDDNYATYGGVRERLDRSRGRVASVFDPAAAAGGERLVPVERMIVPAAGYQEKEPGRETIFDSLAEPDTANGTRPAPRLQLPDPGQSAPPPDNRGLDGLPRPLTEQPDLVLPDATNGDWSPNRPGGTDPDRSAPQLDQPVDAPQETLPEADGFDPAILFD